VVDDYGEPSRATSVRRKVYSPAGKLLYDTTWYSSYVSEPKLVRVGTKKSEPKTTTTQTTSTQTTPTTTTPTTTTPTEPPAPAGPH
jgi:hypothetical protein